MMNHSAVGAFLRLDRAGGLDLRLENEGRVLLDQISFPTNEGVFDPEMTRVMTAAFEQICEALKLDGDARAREAIAVRVIELARRGERDPDRIRERVLREATATDLD
jgi:hypothetical protein